jgi:hypothetical protein
MRPTAPIPGRFLYVAWNVSLRLIGPFVTPTRARHRALDAIRSHIGALESIPGIGSIRLLESTFVVPLPGAPSTSRFWLMAAMQRLKPPSPSSVNWMLASIG